MSVKGLDESNVTLLGVDNEAVSGSASGAGATQAQLKAYLNSISEKGVATCSEVEGAVHTYKETAGTYTITAADNWKLDISDLPAYNEYGKPYIYYVVEDPELEGYEITYSGQDSGINGGGDVTITNRKQLGSLKITKEVTVDDKTTDTSALTDGTYVFSITGIAETPTAGISHTVSITFANGRATSYAIDNGTVQTVSGTDNKWAVVVPDLVPGSYTITETERGNLVLKSVTGGSSISEEKVATLIVTDKDTEPTGAAAQVEFTNNIDTTTVKIVKAWEHGSNTLRPSSLTVRLSNGETRTLDASNEWSATVSGLPKNDPTTGDPIVYSWTEESLPPGYYLSGVSESESDGVVITTLTNTYTDTYMPETTIRGKKLWDDGGNTNRPAQITVNLYQGSSETPYRTITVNAPAEGNTDEWPFEFTNLPIFYDDGSLIQYRVEEILPEGYISDYNVNIEFEQATYIAGDATGWIVNSGQGSQVFELCEGTDLGWIVIRHGNDFIVWTPRTATDAEKAAIRTKVVGLSDQFSGINTATGNSMKYIQGVPRTIDVGNKHAVSVYMNGTKVMMKFLNPNAWSDFAYGTIPYTYTSMGGEGGGTITNVRKVIEISGTKTWVDSGRTHNNAQEITLTLKRTEKPVTETSEWETVEVTGEITLAWNGNTYTYSNLPRYQTVDDSTAEYEYKVEETAVNVTEGDGADQHSIQYVIEADGNNFTNTETVTIEATKTWKNGENSANATVTDAAVTFELQRKTSEESWTAASQEGLTNPVTLSVGDTADAEAWKATWSNLPKYEMTEEGGTVTLIQYRVVETAATLSGSALTPGEPAVVTDGTTANIDNYLPVDLTILKVDANGMKTPLKGATFTIQQIDESQAVLSVKGDPVTAVNGEVAGETGSDGIAEFTGLKTGYYIVKETKLPAGYVQTGTGSFYIKVEKGEVKLVERDGSGWKESDGNAKLTFTAADETNPAIATVGNDAGVALPQTGGPGTALYHLLGTALMSLAGFILGGRKRRVA